MRWALVISATLFLCSGVFAYDYAAWIGPDGETVWAHDDLVFTLNVTDVNGSIVPDLPCNATIDNWTSFEPMTYDATQEQYHATFLDVPPLGSIGFDCDHERWLLYVDIVEYAPQLTEITPPFGHVTADDFKLGVFDFDLNDIDDLVVLGDDLRIYAGPDYTVADYVNGGFDASYDFTVSDVDSDGDGDILLGKTDLDTPTNISLLRFGEDFSFSTETLFTGTLIRAFGPVNYDNNFDRDVLIVSGDGELSLTYLMGPNLDSSMSSNLTGDCKTLYILDVNKDFRDDLICLRDLSGAGQTRIQILLHEDYGQTNFSMITQDLPELIDERLLIADLDADGVYEIATAGENITLYDIDFQAGTLIEKQQFWAVYTPWAMGMSDVMNRHQPELHALYFDGLTPPLDNSYSIAFDGLDTEFTINHSTLFDADAITWIDIDDDNDVDVLTGFQTGDKDLRLWNNSIQKYVTLDLLHDFSIDVKPAPEGELNDSVSEIAAFDVVPSATWTYADYFLSIDFAEHHFRNDLFDSRLNRRYYQILANGSYRFNTSNNDEYIAAVQPVTFAGIRASAVTAYKNNSNCVHVPGQPWNITTYCAGYGGENWKQIEMNAAPLIARDTRMNWNRVNGTGSYFEFRNTEDDFSECRFSGYNGTGDVLFTGNTSRSQNNVTYANMTVSVINATIHLNDVRFENTSINASNATLFLRNMASPIHLDRVPGSALHVYQRANVTFRSGGEEMVSRSGSYSNGQESGDFSDVSSIHRDWWIRANDSDLNYTFTFIEDYAYTPVSVTVASLGDDVTIRLNSTGLPEWDYTRNGSHQTNFRNYTLLESIENLSGIRLSLGAAVNLTLQSVENFSNRNLSEGFVRTENGFRLQLPGDYLCSMVAGLFESPLTLTNGVLSDDLSYSDGKATGVITSGHYEVVENVSFSAQIPDASPNVPFDIEVRYADYFERISRTESCNLTLDGQPAAFEGIVLAVGTHSYQIECDSADLPNVQETGEIDVSSSRILADIAMDRQALYSVVIVDDQATVIMSENSVEGYAAYNQQGGTDVYVGVRPQQTVAKPFFYLGEFLNEDQRVSLQR